MTAQKTMNELNGINGIYELQTMIANRKEIYDFISSKNPLAIIDYRHALVNINDIDYFVILKKVGTLFSVKCVWDTANQIQYWNK